MEGRTSRHQWEARLRRSTAVPLIEDQPLLGPSSGFLVIPLLLEEQGKRDTPLPSWGGEEMWQSGLAKKLKVSRCTPNLVFLQTQVNGTLSSPQACVAALVV